MFRIEKFNNKSVSEIQLLFSKNISPDIGISNIKISFNLGSGLLIIKSVEVDGRVLTVTTSPQRPFINYKIEFLSTEQVVFSSEDGEKIQPGTFFSFIGQESENDIRTTMLEQASVYETETDNLLRKVISGMSNELLLERTAIRETANANYISVSVNTTQETRGDFPEEIISRGFGATDRLFHESAYQVDRVSRFPEGTFIPTFFNFNNSRLLELGGNNNYTKVNQSIASFPDFPFSLKFKTVKNEIVSNFETLNNKFEGTTITLSKSNVAIIHSIVLNNVTFYDIPLYGYLIKDNKYDTQNGKVFLSLESNQIKISEAAIINGDFPSFGSNDELKVTYSYVDLGVNIDKQSIEISNLRNISREVAPALTTVFSLKNFPIVNSTGNIPDYGYVEFLDPSPAAAYPFSSTHPAFLTQLVYTEGKLPSKPGEYSMDYSSGRVFVWGASLNDGTGLIPPVINYTYKYIFKEDIDYSVSSSFDIAVIPGRDLLGSEVKVAYSYEQNFIPGIDYIPEVHVETINEYVENRVNFDRGGIFTKNYPITRPFEVFNETTGETYSITGYDQNQIFFSARQFPRLREVYDEYSVREFNSGELLVISEEISNNNIVKLVKFDLLFSNILSSDYNYQGTNTNNSVDFSNPSIFQNEFFYDLTLQDLATNLSKLSMSGDYLINYRDGSIYALVDSNLENFGQISYYYGKLKPTFEQLAGITELGYKSFAGEELLTSVGYDSFGNDSIVLSNLPQVVERFYQDDINRPILFGSKQFGKAGQIVPGSHEFVALDGAFVTDFADGYHILRIPGDPDRTITMVTSETSLIVDLPFTELNRLVSWYIIDFNFSDGYSVVTNFEPRNIKGIYTVTDLQTNSSNNLTNLYDSSLDIVNGNTIVFNNSLIASLPAGTALAIDYTYGSLLVSYAYVLDVLRTSYEWGDNSLNWSISDSIQPGEQYYVSYKYGALREKLLSNFGVLTQINELSDLPLDFDRELYRKFIKGTLPSFLSGPTVPSIKSLVSSVTEISPEIQELSFDEWTVGRDNLYLKEAEVSGKVNIVSGKYGYALFVEDDTVVQFPGEAYISFREGTFEADVNLSWNGIDNAANITFDISASVDDIYIGPIGYNPQKIPFVLNTSYEDSLSVIGRPSNFRQAPGHYIWFDAETSRWNFVSTTDGYGELFTDGGFYIVEDGYYLKSTSETISFDGYGDFLDGDLEIDGYSIRNEFSFSANRIRTIFDTGPDENHNRMTMYVDGSGYLVFKVIDDGILKTPKRPREFSISHNVQSWLEGEDHGVAASWRLNTVDGTDELHLFVDGVEVANLYKYGGRPQSLPSTIVRTEAAEEIITSAVRPIVGSYTGTSSAGDDTFTDLSASFVSDGILVGDLFYILDDSPDSLGNPYTVTGISETSITLSSPLTLSAENIHYSINQEVITCSTNTDIEKIAIYKTDGYVSSELYGVSSVEPDYSTERISGINYITINNGVSSGDRVYVNTLGLTAGRCNNLVYNYQDGYQGNTLQTKSEMPASLAHIDVWKVLVPPVSLSDGYVSFADGLNRTGFTASYTGLQLDGYIAPVCQPTNSVTGKSIAISVNGDNFDFTGTNSVTIYGTTFGGPVSETVTFSNTGVETTVEFFTSISYIEFSFTAVDSSVSIGSLEISEAISFTRQENNGDYAQLSSYENGVFSFVIFGSGTEPFVLESCFYRFDYPTPLRISMSKKGPLYVGCSLNKNNQFNSAIDQFCFLGEMLTDIRAGEDKKFARTITSDFNSPLPLTQTPQTLMLLSFNDKQIKNVSTFYKSFDDNYVTSSNSVNVNFDGSLLVLDNGGFNVSNAKNVFTKNSGTLEFWVSPTVDTWYDKEISRYYFDTSAIDFVDIVSFSRQSITLPNKASRIVAVNLITNPNYDYFNGGFLGIDGKTVFLGKPLPSAQSNVRVYYVSVDFAGDRVSIYKDTQNNLRFSIVASENEYSIAYPIRWLRNTWHRVMVTWHTNSISGQDSMRLFVDGIEGGVLTWGSPGFSWGSGIIWGSATVGTPGSNALSDNIDLEDTFAELYIGNSFSGNNPASARFDNIRFSNTEKQPVLIGNAAYDVNYNSNIDTVLPVVEDNFTTLLLNFNKNLEQSNFLANLYSENTPLNAFVVNVNDSFGILEQKRYRDLLLKLIERMKPSHTKLIARYVSDKPDQG